MEIDFRPIDFRIVGLGPDAVDYLAAWELQREVHAAVVAGTAPPTVLLLEHPPVFTAGKRTAAARAPADPGGAEVIDVDRGGKITFHGPGQLVGYPIVRLPDHVKVVDYVRRVEEALIAVCRDFGVDDRAGRRPQRRVAARIRSTRSAPERKVAALGIRVSRGVTMHGFALNCDVDLAWYDRFVPCGIADAGVTSLSARARPRRHRSPRYPGSRVRRHLADLPAWAPYDRPTADYDSRPSRPRHPRFECSRRGRRLGRPVDSRDHCSRAPTAASFCAWRSATRETPIERKPEWIKTRAKMGPEYTALQNLVKAEGLHTVCQEAGCPNIYECWEDREATFLIGGDQCTRRCDFCQIDTGKPEPLDRDEPRRVAESVQKMGLRYATITGVARDDLPTAAPGCTPRRCARSTSSTPAPASRT